ncbi:manganese catalase family protein [Bacillus sp. SPB7]|nr:manganese catalase family protein [Bacillus rugosus]
MFFQCPNSRNNAAAAVQELLGGKCGEMSPLIQYILQNSKRRF